MPDSKRSPATLAAKLAKAFQALATDLTLVSESDYPYKAFSAAMPQTTALTAESFRAAVGIGRRFTIDLRPADDFFQQYEDPQDKEPEEVKTYALLEKIMKTTLSGLQIVYVGGENVVRVRFYLFGRLEDGSIAGLRSVAIET
jgi:hypothetical protein